VVVVVQGVAVAADLGEQLDVGRCDLPRERGSPLDVLIEPFTSRTYAVATLVFGPGGLLLHHILGRCWELPGWSGQDQAVAPRAAGYPS
jgi:hypothetical protein